jgi:hypothetical protein
MRSLGRRTGKRRGTAEELSTIGVILLLFGVSWAAYAYVQPLVRTENAQGVCTTGSPNLAGVPSCTSLSGKALFFYSIGAVAVVLGSVLLYARLMVWVKDRRGSKAEKGAARPQAGLATITMWKESEVSLSRRDTLP